MADQKKRKDEKKEKFSPISEQSKQKKDSGSPGGGAGRVEDVKGSGVYPASGPLPKENAPYKGEASFGQGKQGEAGYNDSGNSELTSFEGTPDLGGKPQGATPWQPEGKSQGGNQPQGKQGNQPELDPDRELPSGEDAHDRRSKARKSSQ